MHDEAQCGRRDGGHQLAGIRRLHPFAPKADVEGYLAMIGQLETWLAEVTGYDAVSLQPNAGSQGELAGLLAIRGYHRANGDEQRVVCLIPSSAHGTNAASAVLAGMKVVVVACDAQGNVDLGDLRAQDCGARHRPRRAHDHLSVDARRVRAGRGRDLPRGARRGRTGVRRRGKSERAARLRQVRGLRRGRLPPEPAQDVLHPARRRRPRRGSRRGQGAPGAVPAGASAGPAPAGSRPGHRARSPPPRSAARGSFRSAGRTSG